MYLGRSLTRHTLSALGIVLLASCAPERHTRIPPTATAPATVASSPLPLNAAPDTSSWFGAEEAPKRSASTAAVCQIDVGCPFQARPLPACPPEVPNMDAGAIVARLAEWVGKHVTVHGELVASAGSVKLVDSAEARWCAKYPRQLVVAGKASRGVAASLALWDARMPDAFACTGDESLLCCPFPTHAGEVLVSGTIQRGNAAAPFEYVLDHARLCQLAAPVASSEHCEYAGIRFSNGGHVGVPGDECSGRRCVHGTWEDFDTGCLGMVVLEPVKFSPGGVRIVKSQAPALQGALAFMQKNKHSKMAVIGRYTSKSDALARQRASAVYFWLRKHGVPDGQLAVAVLPSDESDVRFAVLAHLPDGAARFEP